MKIPNVVYSLVFLLFFHVSCNDKGDDFNSKVFIWDDIPKKINLRGKKHFFEEVKMPIYLGIKDNYIILGESRRVPVEYPPIHLIDENNINYLFAKGIIGHGPGEISDAWIFDPGWDEQSFWVYSAMGKRFSKFSLSDTFKLAVHQIKQSEEFFMAISMVWSSDSTVMCRMANDKNQFVEFDISGKRINEYGLWKDQLIRNDMNDYMMADLHSGRLSGNPARDVFVLAGAYRDRLEILNDSNKKIITVDGPVNRIPKFKISSGRGQAASVIVDINEPLAYNDVYLTDSHIYALYCGKTEKQLREDSAGSESIFVFNFKGDIQKEYRLDIPINKLVVDENKRKIFGISVDSEPGLIVFNF